MNYEERYKNALAKAREIHHKTNVVQKGLLESLFPELAGSEEERIRKALITFFHNFPYDTIEESGTNPEEAIAWLEKQGKGGDE